MARPYSYASFADVRALLPMLPSPLPGSYRPNGSQVSFHIERASNELDAVLSQVNYGVPIPTGATLAHELLRTWTALGAAWWSAIAMPQGRDSKHAQEYREEWTNILGRIQDHEMELPGVDPTSGTNSFRSPVGDPNAVGASPYFARAELGDR